MIKRLLCASAAAIVAVTLSISQALALPPSVSGPPAVPPYSGGEIGVFEPGGGWNGAVSGTQYATGAQTAEMVIEAPDDYTAVQLLFASGTANGETVQGATVSASSSYGGSSYGTPGVQPYDIYGNPETTMLPVTFNSGGANTTPWATPSSTSSGIGTIALATNAATSTGTSLPFNSTTTNAAYGNATPAVGEYVFDGKGCVPSGSQVTAVTATSISFSGSGLTCSIASGQQVWFAWVQPTLTLSVPASTNPPQINFVHSDWIPIASLPRVDGGIVTGMAASNACLAAGNVIGAVTYNSVTLSGSGSSGACAAGTPFLFSETVTVTSAPSGAYVLPVTSTYGLQIGQAVSGTNIPGGEWITYVGSNYIRVQEPTSGPISLTTITCTNTLDLLTATTGAGVTKFKFISTSAKRLLLVRLNVSGTTVQGWGQSGVYTQPILPDFELNYQSGSGIDGLHLVGSVTNNAGSVTAGTTQLLYGVKFLCAHHCSVVMPVGDSHYAGADTAGSNDNFVRNAAADISTPARPVTVWNAALSGGNMLNYGPPAVAAIQSLGQNGQKVVAVVQGWTHNGGDTLQTFTAKVRSICAVATSYGGNCIVGTEMPRQARLADTYTVAAPGVVNGTAIPVTSQPLSNSNTLVTGACISASASGDVVSAASNTPGAFTLNVTTPVTCPAGSLISEGVIKTGAATTNSTTLPLAYEYPQATGWVVESTNPSNEIPQYTSITASLGATSVTLATPQSVPAGTYINIGNLDPALGIAEQSVGLDLSLSGTPGLMVFDTFTPFEDPNDPGYWLPGCSFSGVHANDATAQNLGALFAPMLRTAIGQ